MILSKKRCLCELVYSTRYSYKVRVRNLYYDNYQLNNYGSITHYIRMRQHSLNYLIIILFKPALTLSDNFEDVSRLINISVK